MRFMVMAFTASPLGRRPLKRRFVTGESRRESNSVRPDSCAIFISPLHRQSIPVRESTSVTASPACPMAASESWGIRPVSAAKTKEKRMIPAKMTFIIPGHPLSVPYMYIIQFILLCFVIHDKY